MEKLSWSEPFLVPYHECDGYDRLANAVELAVSYSDQAGIITERKDAHNVYCRPVKIEKAALIALRIIQFLAIAGVIYYKTRQYTLLTVGALFVAKLIRRMDTQAHWSRYIKEARHAHPNYQEPRSRPVSTDSSGQSSSTPVTEYRPAEASLKNKNPQTVEDLSSSLILEASSVPSSQTSPSVSSPRAKSSYQRLLEGEIDLEGRSKSRVDLTCPDVTRLGSFFSSLDHEWKRKKYLHWMLQVRVRVAEAGQEDELLNTSAVKILNAEYAGDARQWFNTFIKQLELDLQHEETREASEQICAELYQVGLYGFAEELMGLMIRNGARNNPSLSHIYSTTALTPHGFSPADLSGTEGYAGLDGFAGLLFRDLVAIKSVDSSLKKNVITTNLKKLGTKLNFADLMMSGNLPHMASVHHFRIRDGETRAVKQLRHPVPTIENGHVSFRPEYLAFLRSCRSKGERVLFSDHEYAANYDEAQRIKALAGLDGDAELGDTFYHMNLPIDGFLAEPWKLLEGDPLRDSEAFKGQLFSYILKGDGSVEGSARILISLKIDREWLEGYLNSVKEVLDQIPGFEDLSFEGRLHESRSTAGAEVALVEKEIFSLRRNYILFVYALLRQGVINKYKISYFADVCKDAIDRGAVNLLADHLIAGALSGQIKDPDYLMQCRYLFHFPAFMGKTQAVLPKRATLACTFAYQICKLEDDALERFRSLVKEKLGLECDRVEVHGANLNQSVATLPSEQGTQTDYIQCLGEYQKRWLGEEVSFEKAPEGSIEAVKKQFLRDFPPIDPENPQNYNMRLMNEAGELLVGEKAINYVDTLCARDLKQWKETLLMLLSQTGRVPVIESLIGHFNNSTLNYSCAQYNSKETKDLREAKIERIEVAGTDSEVPQRGIRVSFKDVQMIANFDGDTIAFIPYEAEFSVMEGDRLEDGQQLSLSYRYTLTSSPDGVKVALSSDTLNDWVLLDEERT